MLKDWKQILKVVTVVGGILGGGAEINSRIEGVETRIDRGFGSIDSVMVVRVTEVAKRVVSEAVKTEIQEHAEKPHDDAATKARLERVENRILSRLESIDAKVDRVILNQR